MNEAHLSSRPVLGIDLVHSLTLPNPLAVHDIPSNLSDPFAFAPCMNELVRFLVMLCHFFGRCFQ